jgi:hypothetical protein
MESINSELSAAIEGVNLDLTSADVAPVESDLTSADAVPVESSPADESNIVLTNYATTVFYDPNDLFQTIISMVFKRQNRIPVSDLGAFKYNCELTPNVIFFTTPPPGIIDILLLRGYQYIYIMNGVSTSRRVTSWSPLGDFPVDVIEGFSVWLIIESLLSVYFNHSSSQISPEDADGFIYELKSSQNPELLALELMSKYDGIRQIEVMSKRGIGKKIANKQLTDELINNGYVYEAKDMKYVVAIPHTSLDKACVEQISNATSGILTRVSYVLFYTPAGGVDAVKYRCQVRTCKSEHHIQFTSIEGSYIESGVLMFEIPAKMPRNSALPPFF